METLENLVLINDGGQPVYLRSVADIEIRPGEAAIRHYLGSGPHPEPDARRTGRLAGGSGRRRQD
jgi:hypothetical protein